MITILASLFEWVPGAGRLNVLRPQNELKPQNELAMNCLAAGRTAKAIRLYKRTLADCERVLRPGHPDTKAVRENLAASTGA